MTITFSVVGAGLIGTQRVKALARLPGTQIKWIVDLDEKKGRELSQTCGAQYSSRWEEVAGDSSVNAIIVCVYHDTAPQVSLAALKNKKHVLCEKPLGRNAKEALALVNQAEQNQRILKTGFNYRHYPGIAKAYQLMQQKVVGDIKIMRIVLGHGGRPGYEKEWRTDPEKGGGGALLDPGVHCLDLMRWFCGEPRRASFYPSNAFWPIRHEDNALALFQFDNNVTTFVQSSITEWRNKFRLEIIGTDGYIRVEGRGGSYGAQQLTYAPKWWWLKSPPAEEVVETYPNGDESFYEETKEFVEAIRQGRQPIGNGRDGLRVAEIVDQLYEAKNRHDIVLS